MKEILVMMRKKKNAVLKYEYWKGLEERYAPGNVEKKIQDSIKSNNDQGDGYYIGTKNECDTLKGFRNKRVADGIMDNNFPLAPFTNKRKINSRKDELKAVTQLLGFSDVFDDDDDDDDESNKKKRRLPASPNCVTVPVATTNVINPAATTNVTNPTGGLSLFGVGGVRRHKSAKKRLLHIAPPIATPASTIHCTIKESTTVKNALCHKRTANIHIQNYQTHNDEAVTSIDIGASFNDHESLIRMILVILPASDLHQQSVKAKARKTI